jgi:hypothetical protein
MNRKYLWAFAIMILLTPLGRLAEGTAWGEWGGEYLTEALGFVPLGIEQAGEWWQAMFPDYTVHALGEGKLAESAGYALSAIVGSALVYGITLAYMKLMARTEIKS